MQNPDPQELERQQKLALMRWKISLYATVGWGIVALFLMVGICVNREMAIAGMMLVGTVWVQFEIISRASTSFTILRNWKALTEPPPRVQNDPSENREEEE